MKYQATLAELDRRVAGHLDEDAASVGEAEARSAAETVRALLEDIARILDSWALRTRRSDPEHPAGWGAFSF